MTDSELRQLEKPTAFSLWLNTLPLLHLVSGVTLVLWLCDSTEGKLMLLTAWIYLLPPLASRLTLTFFGRPQGRFTQDTSAYRVWWILTQWQILFNRLPCLEELLRMVPGLYALWIGLWGGSISPFAISDRGYGSQTAMRFALIAARCWVCRAYWPGIW